MRSVAPKTARRLVLVLGDQLNEHSAAFEGFDSSLDVVWMAEAADESSHVWSHKARIAIFLSAMRHFRDRLVRKGYRVDYRRLDAVPEAPSLVSALEESAHRLKPSELVMVRAGEWRVARMIETAAKRLSLPLEVHEDAHFFCTPEDFAKHAASRKELVMEFFYREMRRRAGVLMNDGKPCGGVWNLDKENRDRFGKEGPPRPLPERPSFANNPRMALQLRNLRRIGESERRDLRAAAKKTRAMAIG